MNTTKRLAAVAVVSTLLLPALGSPASAQAPKNGGVSAQTQAAPANIQVNPSLGPPAAPYTNNFTQNFQMDPTIAQDPVTSAFVAGAMDYVDEAPCVQTGTSSSGYLTGYCQPSWWYTGIDGLYLSSDGANWTQPTASDGATSSSGASCTATTHTVPGYCASGLASGYDPQVTFGPKPKKPGVSFTFVHGARAYYADLPLQLNTNVPNPAVAVSRSDDDGHTWLAPVVLPGTTSHSIVNDKDALWVDANASSPCFGDAYLAWDVSFDNTNTWQVAFSRSTDGGSTWSSYITLLPQTTSLEPGPVIRSLPDGTAVVAFPGGVSGVPTIRDIPLTNCGQVVAAPVAVATFGNPPGVFPGALFPVWDFPMLASDNTGRLYLTWIDWTSGVSVLRFSMSADEGKTWSAPVAVSSGAGNAVTPAIAVTPDGAQILIQYQNEVATSQTAGAGSASIQTVYVRSTDGGATWAQNPLSPSPVDVDGSSTPQLDLQRIGDTAAMIVATINRKQVAIPVWTDTRSAVPCPLVDSYRASLRAGHPASRPDPDVSNQCPLGFGNSDIDDALIPLN